MQYPKMMQLVVLLLNTRFYCRQLWRVGSYAGRIINIMSYMSNVYKIKVVCMYVCMCMCVCVCVYVCVYMCVHVCVYICMFAYSSRTDTPICTRLGLIMHCDQEEILERSKLRKMA
jgi:hypothetical protein